jgi:site-specific recombinase XerD
MNSYLKEIADICGIAKPVSTHTARHTFATTVALENNMPLEVVSKTLGHSSIKMTQRYARTTEELIKKNMTKIAGLY